MYNMNQSLVFQSVTQIAWKQALWGTLAAGWEKERELANASLEFEFHLQFPVVPRQLSCHISANQRKVEMSANVNKHWKTCAKHSDVIANVISANQHFALTFSKQINKFQRCSCKLSFLLVFPPHHQSPPESLLAGYSTDHSEETIWGVKAVTFWLR